MIGSARVWRQAAVPAALIVSALMVGCQDRVTQPRSATRSDGTSAHDASPPVSVYFHGTGNNANPATLSLNTTAPTGTTAKYRDTPSVNFNNGNAWQSAGTWLAAASLTSTTISSLGDVHLWLGLKNSDDVGTRFDVRVEAYKNGTLFASGETHCVQSLASGANNADEVVVAFDAVTAVTFNGSSDVLSIKQLTRVGTNATGGLCGGHSNAVGLRSYFDASNRAAAFTLVAPGAIVLSVSTNGHVDGIVDTTLEYTAGATVPYTITPQSGFTSLLVLVDSVAVPASGTILMNRSHSVLAIALADTTPPQADPQLVARLRSLVTSPTPVASYQSYVNDMITLALQVGSTEAQQRISAATIRAFSISDSAAIRAFGASLDGQEFFYPGTPNAVTTPWPTGDTIPNGYPFNLTTSALRAPDVRAQARTRNSFLRQENVTFNGPVDPRPLDIVHINGWFTTQFDAALNLADLVRLGRSSYLFATSPTANYSLVYNDNYLSRNVINSQLACLNRAYPEALQYAPALARAYARGSRCPDSLMAAFLVTGGDQFSQALLQLRDIVAGTPPSISNVALTKVVEKMQRAHSGQNHVIFVPHSQGNLYAIQALAAATSAGTAPTDADSACVGWVPVASPTRVGYPSGSPRLSPVQLEGDIILGWPDPAVFPKFPASATPLSDSVLNVLRSRSTNPIFAPRNAVFAKRDSTFLHSFREAYLAQAGGAQHVLEALASVYSACEPVLTLSTPTFPLSPGEQATASVSIAGADGRPIELTSTLRWSTSDSSVVRIDQTGLLTAVASGDARISVRYRGKIVDAIVGVISTSQNDVVLDVQNTVTPNFTAPFQFVGWGIMRRRTVAVRAQAADSTVYVGWVNVGTQDMYGHYWIIQNYTQYSTDGRTFVATTEYFDNPHNADGTPSSFQTRNGGYFIMKPEIFVQVILSTGVSHWYRVPIQ